MNRPTQKANHRFDDGLVTCFREMTVEKAALLLGLYCKKDSHYESTTHKNSTCYHISKDGEVFEIVVTQLKWYSTRRGVGGGGAIDLTMHLYSEPFKAALARLIKCQRKADIPNILF